MKVSVTGIALDQLDVDLVLVPLTEEAAAESPDAVAGRFGEGARRAAADFDGKAGASVLFYPERARARRVAFLGLGPASKADAEALRRAAAVGSGLAAGCKAKTAAVVVPGINVDGEAASQALVEGFVLAAYRFTRYKTTEDDDYPGVERLVLHAEPEERASRRGAERGKVVAEATATARDLVNLSPDEKTPTLFARAIERVGKKHGFDVDIWDRTLIEEEKMGGLLAVNRGSVEPPTFSILTWRPDNAVNERPIVLVGKGVVFDTGGLSLKDTLGSMDHMKADMAGAAAVVGAMEAIARLEVPAYVIALIPATDNRPGENAYVPGDVVRMHSGKTVEVLNTDAEGRMLLADALSYAKTYKPTLVVDVATLTGAAVVALGREVAAVMTNEGTDGAEDRIAALQAAGRRTGERVFPLPMYEDYGKLIESPVADIKNVGGRAAGSITAGKFLEHFVDYPWLHLDIAGTAFTDDPKPYSPKGGTGFGVRLLTEFLREYASPKRRR